jgi:hypothetical protein
MGFFLVTIIRDEKMASIATALKTNTLTNDKSISTPGRKKSVGCGGYTTSFWILAPDF